ncbi:hypothetical protein FACS189446_6360 [Bacteroidia bacterium]|nr:hypothetical protein FACS189446_6360 [Bacteroidia bacterium]
MIMKKIFAITLVLLLIVNNIQAQGKIKIAIVDLSAGVGRGQSQVAGLSDMLTAELFKTGQFTIIERTQVNQIIKEQNFQKSNLSNAQIKTIGNILDVKALLIGTVNFIIRDRTIEDVVTEMAKGEYNVDIRLVDVENGEILSAAGGNQYNNQTERSLMKIIAQELTENMLDANLDSKPQEVIILYDYLYVYPEDLGKFSSAPQMIITAINKNNTYGYNDWRLPTKEEVEVLNSNRKKLGMLNNTTYAHSDGFNSDDSYLIRLVRTEVLVQQPDTKPEVNPYLEKTTYDFGTIPVLSGSVKTSFVIQNPTKETLYITSVKTTCTCLIADWTRYAISPGESGTIAVKFLTNGRQGMAISKSLTATLSNGEKLMMYVKGNVE